MIILKKKNPLHVNKITEAMDIFSIGCIIAEIYLDGEPLFDLSQLLNYANNQYNPANILEKISNIQIKSLISHMIQINPLYRLSAKQYLKQYTDNGLFPGYFAFYIVFFLNY